MYRFAKLFGDMVEEPLPGVATEATQATQSSETEVVVYCKVMNFDGLQQASRVELHEQLETQFSNGTRCRVRKTTQGAVVAVESEEPEPVTEMLLGNSGTDAYVFTFKVPSGSEEGFDAHTEFSVPVDKDFFEGFRAVADHRLMKTRYVFASNKIILQYVEGQDDRIIEVPNITYEVDVYLDSSGQICEWVKIDIEIDPILDHLKVHYPDLNNIKLNVKITHLPFEPADPILTLSATDDQQTFIDVLWRDHFRLAPQPT